MDIRLSKIPKFVKEKINSVDPDAEVILFGSKARGDHNANSDWDFLILLNNPVEFEIEDLIRNKLYEIELEHEEIITSIIEEKIAWKKYEKSLIYKNIEEQGIQVI